MKYIRFLLFSLLFAPMAAFGATNDFMVAAQLLSAAKNADIQQVQVLVNNGADVNYTDSTGLSIVCTALMNNDVRAAQILQMYGADASKCDQQIKQYNSKNKPKSSGGLFSGLSSAQSITLAAAGAAVVIGGLLLLTDVFDPDNGNDSGSSSGGSHGGGSSGGNTGGGATAAFTLPYGPAMPNAASEIANYAANLNYYSPSEDGILKDNFTLMTDTFGQNYLLMMHGYSPLARGYMGMQTLRNLTTREPISLAGNNLGTEPVLGGRPVNVALITTNGVNATESSSLGDRLLLWTTTNDNGTVANGASNEMVSSKYYNNVINRGTDNSSISDDTTSEDATFVGDFDLSGHGTAINNSSATDLDNLLGKVVGGKDTGYAVADYMGFMPNGQMTIFRTGGGQGLKTVSGASPTGTYEMAGTSFATGDKITLFGKTLTLTMNGANFTATDGTTTYNGYIGADGLLYIDSAADGVINQAYTLSDNNLTLTRELGAIDYNNYKALVKAGALWYAGDLSGGRSRPEVVANASVIMPLRATTAKTVADVLSFSGSQNQQAAFISFVNEYYDVDKTDGTGGSDALPGTDAATFFSGLGSSYTPLVLFSTGSFETDSGYTGRTYEATFENSAPLVFSNLEHLFMSVVAVGLTGNGTSGTTSVAGYTPATKYVLAQWQDKNGTPDDTSDDKYYKARVCGISAGKGSGGIDPWCFAAAGITDEMAVSSAAGAAGAVKSAFSYMNNKQLFALLALTADGPYLGSASDGTALSEDALAAYLQDIYQLPTEYQYRVDSGGEDYLEVFKEVFGYGLINLARATTPNTKVYYYDGTNIVSASGNAYWRAASNTVFRSSGVFNPRAASISAPFYDLLESIDGELAMPRIWQNEFALGTQDARGLYMGDTLGELKTRKDAPHRVQIGKIGFSMESSARPYADNLGGLDSMSLDFQSGNWNFAGGFQRYFTDGHSRFTGMANPILGLASNAVVSDATYNTGRWSFGARAFSGAITDESLLENDPTISAQYTPARLGLMQVAQSDVAWRGDKFGFNASVGTAHETDTVLGAQTGGLLSLGQGDTTYVDTELKYMPVDNLTFTARATFARTTADARGEFILGMSDVYSNAFGVAVDAGNFSLSVAQPLAVRRGNMKYAYADYDIVENAEGNFDLSIADTHIAALDLSAEKRELRFSGTYRHNFGEFTDGALGFIYRINPNHTDEFGNETILMMKLTHRVGI